MTHRSSVHNWALTWFCCLLAQLARLWSYKSGKPTSMLFFYPWIKTEKTVSWRQMRLTAGTEWKVSFNLGLGYNLSGLIGAKHHSFHHGEDVMLIHLNKGTIWVAWLLADLHKLFSSFQVFSDILKRMQHTIFRTVVHLLHMCQLSIKCPTYLVRGPSGKRLGRRIPLKMAISLIRI